MSKNKDTDDLLTYRGYGRTQDKAGTGRHKAVQLPPKPLSGRIPKHAKFTRKGI